MCGEDEGPLAVCLLSVLLFWGKPRRNRSCFLGDCCVVCVHNMALEGLIIIQLSRTLYAQYGHAQMSLYSPVFSLIEKSFILLFGSTTREAYCCVVVVLFQW